jgi:hypothetical protein
MRSVIEKIVKNDGILAVGYRHKDDPIELVAGASFPADRKLQWKGIVLNLSNILDIVQDDVKTWERSVSPPRSILKCDIGPDAWNAARQGDLTLVLISVKGHPISKSLKRMIRRGFKNINKLDYSYTPPAGTTLRLLPDPVPEAGTPEPVSDTAKTTKIDTTV